MLAYNPRITRHEMPDPPPDHRKKRFVLSPRRFPALFLPPLMENPPAGRVVLKANIRAPIFDPGDNIEAYRADLVQAEQAALRRRELLPDCAVRP